MIPLCQQVEAGGEPSYGCDSSIHLVHSLFPGWPQAATELAFGVRAGHLRSGTFGPWRFDDADIT